MPLTGLRLGLFAWGNRRAVGRGVVLAVAAVFALPVVLSLAVVGAVAGGAASAVPPGSTARPMNGWVVTQPYGCTGLSFEPPRGTCAHFHFGIDLAAPAGTPVAAVLPGRAEVLAPAGYGGGYGIHVVVHHAVGFETMYAHLAAVDVVSGQQLSAGAVLGAEGSTGLSTGPHLHFEVRQAGAAVDPISVFPGIFGPEGQPR
jgi:murein DD-endopeptidase MepM/ murein hydrolase activator NlpD